MPLQYLFHQQFLLGTAHCNKNHVGTLGDNVVYQLLLFLLRVQIAIPESCDADAGKIAIETLNHLFNDLLLATDQINGATGFVGPFRHLEPQFAAWQLDRILMTILLHHLDGTRSVAVAYIAVDDAACLVGGVDNLFRVDGDENPRTLLGIVDNIVETVEWVYLHTVAQLDRSIGLSHV